MRHPFSAHARRRMRQRRIPMLIAIETYLEFDGVDWHPDPDRAGREIRWRRYDDQVPEIVVDVTDDTIVSAWITRVSP